MVTGSRELIRDMNRKLVLETIINEGPLSRAAISKKLGLTKATISAIVQELLDTAYVEEIGSDDTSFGRKPILLRFCRQNGYIFTLDLGVESATLMYCDLLGRNCRLFQYPLHPNRENILPFLLQILNMHLASLPPTPFGVVGVSLGIHGTVQNNRITFTPNYDLAGISLAEDLQKALHLPVWLENEANLSALAEKTFVENHKNLIHISIHSGVGAGIILEHNLYKGIGGTAGEFGHTIVEPDGILCPCGNHGCLEQYISLPSILRFYCSQKGSDDSLSVDDLVSAYRKNEPEALKTAERFVKYLSCGINNLWNLFCPECITINSLLTTYLPDLLPMVSARLSPRFHSSCTLKLSSLQDTGVLLGGVRICAGKFLELDKLCLKIH
ncbi:MAG: ROK family transcriptional regulator [Clostridiales bacterium]|nr:ROK family transcriptional regulator [Clostridiales bacterium]